MGLLVAVAGLALLFRKLAIPFLQELRELVAVVADRVAKLETHIADNEKRRWQFVYIFAGAVATLLVTVIVQLVLLPLVKK